MDPAGEEVVNMDALLSTAYEIALAMRYLHSLNILHGDLTGNNVLLTSPTSVSPDPRGFVAKVDFDLKIIIRYTVVCTGSYRSEY